MAPLGFEHPAKLSEKTHKTISGGAECGAFSSNSIPESPGVAAERPGEGGKRLADTASASAAAGKPTCPSPEAHQFRQAAQALQAVSDDPRLQGIVNVWNNLPEGVRVALWAAAEACELEAERQTW